MSLTVKTKKKYIYFIEQYVSIQYWQSPKLYSWELVQRFIVKENAERVYNQLCITNPNPVRLICLLAKKGR